MRLPAFALNFGLAALSIGVLSSCGAGAALFAVTAADAVAEPQTETTDPDAIQTEDANMVILLETGGHPDVTSAQVSIGDIRLGHSSNSLTSTTSVGAVLPVDLATLDGDCCVVTADRLSVGREYDQVTVDLRIESILDAYGQNLAVTSVETITLPLKSAVRTDNASTLVIQLDLSKVLEVDSDAGTAVWNGDAEADVISFESGNYDLGTLPVQTVGGTLADVNPEEGVMRLIVSQDQDLSVPVVMRPGVTVENEFGRGEVIDVAEDVDFTFWPQQTVVLDGTHVNPSITLPPDIVEPDEDDDGGSGGGTIGGGEGGSGGDDGGAVGGGEGDDDGGIVDGGEEPNPPHQEPGVIPPSEDPNDYGEHPDDIEIDGGASRVVRTAWDPLMRGVVSAVYEDYLEMLVITTIGPGSPDVFSIVQVNWRSDAFWTREDNQTLTDVGIEDVAIGQEILVNTLPMGDNWFEADRVELLKTTIQAELVRVDEEGNSVISIKRIEGVEPGLLGTAVYGEFVLAGAGLPARSDLGKTLRLTGRFLPESRTFKLVAE